MVVKEAGSNPNRRLRQNAFPVLMILGAHSLLTNSALSPSMHAGNGPEPVPIHMMKNRIVCERVMCQCVPVLHGPDSAGWAHVGRAGRRGDSIAKIREMQPLQKYVQCLRIRGGVGEASGEKVGLCSVGGSEKGGATRMMQETAERSVVGGESIGAHPTFGGPSRKEAMSMRGGTKREGEVRPVCQVCHDRQSSYGVVASGRDSRRGRGIRGGRGERGGRGVEGDRGGQREESGHNRRGKDCGGQIEKGGAEKREEGEGRMGGCEGGGLTGVNNGEGGQWDVFMCGPCTRDFKNSTPDMGAGRSCCPSSFFPPLFYNVLLSVPCMCVFRNTVPDREADRSCFPSFSFPPLFYNVLLCVLCMCVLKIRCQTGRQTGLFLERWIFFTSVLIDTTMNSIFCVRERVRGYSH